MRFLMMRCGVVAGVLGLALGAMATGAEAAKKRKRVAGAVLPVTAGAILPVTAAVAASKPSRAKVSVAVPSTLAAPAPQPAQSIARGLPARLLPSTPPPLLAVASINGQSITVYNGTEVVARSSISTGMAGHRTPTGVFSILQRNRHHESNLYSNSPMPFMQRLTWSGIALHAGVVPGYPASHGCVRLPEGFAQRLWGMLRIGTRVIVAPNAPAPFVIEHAKLPAPIFSPARELTADEQVAEQVQTVGPGWPRRLASASPFMLVSAATAAPGAGLHMLNPVQAAEAEKRRTSLLAATARADAQARLAHATDAVQHEHLAALDVREVDGELDGLRALLAGARQLAAVAATDEDKVQAAASTSVVEEEIADVMAYRAQLVAEKDLVAGQAFEAARQARAAEDAAEKAEFAATAAQMGTEPISVFVSRKAGRVFVRQGFTPLFEGEVTISDIEAPLGTHVFTALAPVADGAQLRWSVISVADGRAGGASARTALDRIEFAPDIAMEIGRRAWTGASLIISDHGISTETGKGTDFVVLTR